MTMTLGFDTISYLEAFVDQAAVRAALVAIARHAPGEPVRFADYTRDGYVVVEIDRDGTFSTPDPAPFRAAIAEVGDYVEWPNDRAPEWLPPLILPGGGWDLAALLAEPAIQALVAEERYFRDLHGTDRALGEAGERGGRLLRAAEKHRLVTCFR